MKDTVVIDENSTTCVFYLATLFTVDWVKLKAFAGNKINFVIMMISDLDGAENIVRKGYY